MKLIFLDIDGVMNHELWFKQRRENVKEVLDKADYEVSMFDPRAIEIFNHIIEKTQAKVVVSSSWRHGRSVEQLQTLFSRLGFKCEVIDKTPTLNFQPTSIKTVNGEIQEYNYSVPRGCEIKAWLEMNKDILGDKMSKVKYAIIDDDSDMLYWQREKYFRTDAYCGLTYNVAYRIINYLNS